jgi:DNA-binding response OmpR family regulator
MCRNDREQRPKILAADESRIIRQLIRVNLEVDGFQVCEAETESECIEVAEAEGCQLLLISLDMPGLDAMQVVQGIRQREGWNLPVLIISSEEPSTALMQALEPAVYIRKPFDATELSRRVEMLLGEHSEN